MAASTFREPRDWTVSPGELLAEILEERGISQSELARRMGRPTKTINEIVNGKAAVTPQTAIQLERVLGTSATFWVNAEAAYRHDLARFAEAEQHEADAPWLERFPIKDLIREGFLKKNAPVNAQIEGLLQFFEVGSRDAWTSRWGQMRPAYRLGAGEATIEARAAWLRWGELAARDANVAPFNATALRELLPEIVRLSTVAPPQAAIEELSGTLADVGVAFVLLPEFAGVRLSGAAHWPTPARPVIQISTRYGTDDQFWFTVLHELGHILDAPRETFADGPVGDEADEPEDVDDAEEQADRIAREALVPSGRLREFLATSRSDDRAGIRAFARTLGVAPGIVVGRLQRDNKLDWKTSLNDLKRKYELD
jgi:HTH-type transcriptional regulator / antitoxin HigA